MLRQIIIALCTLSTAVAENPSPLAIGQPAPGFTVTARDGSQLKLSSFKGKSHLLVVFGRAHW